MSSARQLPLFLSHSARAAKATPGHSVRPHELPCTCASATKARTTSRSVALSTTASARSASIKPTEQPAATTSTSIAQESFNRRRRARPLPVIKDQRWMYLGVAVGAISAWTFFTLWAMSAEKAASSVVRTLAFNLRSSPIVEEALGKGVRPKAFLLGSEPWVHGTVNTIQGTVDINFRVQSAEGREGTIFFKSERRNKAGRFETTEFKLVIDGKPQQVVDLKNTDLLGLGLANK